MPTCTPPSSTSPGFLFLKYTHQGQVEHTARWAFIVGVDISDTTVLEVEADRIASQMAHALPDSFIIHDWGILDHNAVVFYTAALATPYTGSHSTAAGQDDSLSKTITFTGKGQAPAGGICAGQTRSVLFVGKAYHFLVGAKRISAHIDSGLEAYWLALNDSTFLPADDYGQQVTFGASAPIQFNGHTQRKEGT